VNANLLQTELVRIAPLMATMEGVPQDPVWHAEGDVWIHTEMVRAALENIPAFQALSEHEQNVLRLAAAAHDIGKATTTREENGHIGAPGHSLRSAEAIQLVWWREGYLMDRPTRHLIHSLVRYHGRPLHGEDKLETHTVSTSVVTSCKLVAILAEADVRGRVSPNDGADKLLQIEMFRECARELGCFDGPYQWPNPHAKWSFFQRKRDLAYAAFDDRTFTVHMTFGLPGSGKSSLTRTLGLPVISRDELRAAAGLDPADKSDQGRASQLFQKALREQLRKKEDCVIDGTNLIRNLRGNTIDLCVNYGAAITLHCLDRDRPTIWKQNRDREAVVPECVIERMAESMELPEETEAHRLEWC